MNKYPVTIRYIQEAENLDEAMDRVADITERLPTPKRTDIGDPLEGETVSTIEN